MDPRTLHDNDIFVTPRPKTRPSSRRLSLHTFTKKPLKSMDFISYTSFPFDGFSPSPTISHNYFSFR